MQTLPLSEETWTAVVATAAKEAEIKSQDASGSKEDETKEDETKEDETKEGETKEDETKEDETKEGETKEGEKELGEVEGGANPPPCPMDVENLDPANKDEKSSEASENESFPMVRREDQQAFKDSKANVAKMDQQREAPAQPPKKPRRKPALKRPAASTPEGSKNKAAKLASPVEVVDDNMAMDSEGEPGGPDPRQDLEGKFQAVATEPSAASTPVTPKAKAAPKRSAAKRRAQPKPKASPKSAKSTKSEKSEKGKKVDKKVDKKEDKKEKAKDGKKDQIEKANPETEEGDGKKTFAGRRAPKNGDAKLRFLVLKAAFETHIQPHVTQHGSMAEALFSKMV